MTTTHGQHTKHWLFYERADCTRSSAHPLPCPPTSCPSRPSVPQDRYESHAHFRDVMRAETQTSENSNSVQSLQSCRREGSEAAGDRAQLTPLSVRPRLPALPSPRQLLKHGRAAPLDQVLDLIVQSQPAGQDPYSLAPRQSAHRSEVAVDGGAEVGEGQVLVT